MIRPYNLPHIDWPVIYLISTNTNNTRTKESHWEKSKTKCLILFLFIDLLTARHEDHKCNVQCSGDLSKVDLRSVKLYPVFTTVSLWPGKAKLFYEV